MLYIIIFLLPLFIDFITMKTRVYNNLGALCPFTREVFRLSEEHAATQMLIGLFLMLPRYKKLEPQEDTKEVVFKRALCKVGSS